MTETRLVRRRGAAQLRAALPAALLLFLVAVWTLPVQVQAQEPDPSSDTAAMQEGDTAGVDEFPTETENECLPPSTQEWVLIAAGTVAIFVVCFFLLVRVVQRYFIGRDWSATLGRHWGIS